MRYWKPELIFAEFMGPPGQFVDQFGGIPWGLPEDKWPTCSGCEAPMSLLAQFAHHSDRLDLGKDGRVLYVFICGDDCETWDPECGANKVLILDDAEMKPGRTPLPPDLTPDHLLPECRITCWTAKDDGLSEELAPWFVSPDMDPSHSGLSEEDRVKPEYCTRLGSVPTWIQHIETPDGFRFAGQIVYCLEIHDPIHAKISCREVNGKTTCEIHTGRTHPLYIYPATDEKGKWFLEFADFGDCGMGYLFVDPDPVRPDGRFLWQCY
ncbi:hypothetical protein [Staphylospora marina]|uniref:hypothetical protein n=1 Tax=Staphylospora marina TaxID=2490858 RepID=UPI000F5C1AE3|nr:hypothetical protein [Staphylospora marina]